MASANSTSAASGSPSEVCRRACVARKEAFEEVDAVLTHEGDALVPGRERAAHIGLGERHPCDPERVGDPIRVAERSRGGDGFFGERERLLDPAARLEAVDIGGEAVAAIASVPLGHRTGELDIAIEVAAVDAPSASMNEAYPGSHAS